MRGPEYIPNATSGGAREQLLTISWEREKQNSRHSDSFGAIRFGGAIVDAYQATIRKLREIEAEYHRVKTVRDPYERSVAFKSLRKAAERVARRLRKLADERNLQNSG